jgi:glycosyltransferase involved in cell wall biosynthesis
MLRRSGVSLHVLTRPGYPWDRRDRCNEPPDEETVVDGICYRHSRKPDKRRPVALFALAASKVVAREAVHKKVAGIHAASNHVNALPALLAARRLGVPFFYEMRGLWELSKAARQPSFNDSSGYHLGIELEGFVARHADHIFVISAALGHYIQERFNLPQERISLLPNCAELGSLPLAPVDLVVPGTIGYAGSLIEYEGLDTLLEAVAKLRQLGTACQLKIAGQGECRAPLESLATRLHLGDSVQFLGQLNPEEACQMIARCSLVCIPRKPYEVCQLVPPIKLVEAMAMGKAVVVPDLPVFRDEAGEAALFFESGNAESLARTLKRALGDTSQLQSIGFSARARVVRDRTWDQHVPKIAAQLRAITREPYYA